MQVSAQEELFLLELGPRLEAAWQRLLVGSGPAAVLVVVVACMGPAAEGAP